MAVLTLAAVVVSVLFEQWGLACLLTVENLTQETKTDSKAFFYQDGGQRPADSGGEQTLTHASSIEEDSLKYFNQTFVLESIVKLAEHRIPQSHLCLVIAHKVV